MNTDERATDRGADRRQVLRPLRDFLATEVAGGVLLVVGIVVALLWANGPWRSTYESLWGAELHLGIGGAALHLDVRHVVSDGLMTLFFLVAGLEIKREVVEGELRGLRRAALPAIAALGGMVVPAALHLVIAWGSPAHRGWAIPMATDIALAVGVTRLLGARVPRGAVLFLLALAIVDDLGAIVVIAAFYSGGLAWWWLGAAFVLILLTVLVRRSGTHRVGPFVVIGAALWLCLHEAGVHPTLAGVAMGLLAPVRPVGRADVVDADDPDGPDRPEGSVSVVEWLAHRLHPWTSLLVVPLFAVASAGVRVDLASLLGAWSSPGAWAVVVGLAVGKPMGIFTATALAQRFGAGRLPAGVALPDVLAVGVLGGIGFTVSMFVTSLAFPAGSDEAQHSSIGVLVASLLCALLGALVVSGSSRWRRRSTR